MSAPQRMKPLGGDRGRSRLPGDLLATLQAAQGRSKRLVGAGIMTEAAQLRLNAAPPAPTAQDSPLLARAPEVGGALSSGSTREGARDTTTPTTHSPPRRPSTRRTRGPQPRRGTETRNGRRPVGQALDPLRFGPTSRPLQAAPLPRAASGREYRSQVRRVARAPSSPPRIPAGRHVGHLAHLPAVPAAAFATPAPAGAAASAAAESAQASDEPAAGAGAVTRRDISADRPHSGSGRGSAHTITAATTRAAFQAAPARHKHLSKTQPRSPHLPWQQTPRPHPRRRRRHLFPRGGSVGTRRSDGRVVCDHPFSTGRRPRRLQPPRQQPGGSYQPGRCRQHPQPRVGGRSTCSRSGVGRGPSHRLPSLLRGGARPRRDEGRGSSPTTRRQPRNSLQPSQRPRCPYPSKMAPAGHAPEAGVAEPAAAETKKAPHTPIEGRSQRLHTSGGRPRRPHPPKPGARRPHVVVEAKVLPPTRQKLHLLHMPRRRSSHRNRQGTGRGVSLDEAAAQAPSPVGRRPLHQSRQRRKRSHSLARQAWRRPLSSRRRQITHTQARDPRRLHPPRGRRGVDNRQ